MRVEFEGLDEFDQGLRRVDTQKILQKSYRKTIREVVADTRSNIQRADMPQRSVASAGVEERVTPESVALGIDQTNPVVKAAIYGTALHYLWGVPVAASQLSRRVFPEWVGANPDPEDLHSVVFDLDEIAEDWLDDVHQAIGREIDAQI